ncbi:hypothetical protein [Parafrankia sp. FMc2]|uniref:hypothetical protein n=1 Tax=Parafrankia sp. FMc2 TaxID=3233196 RepID=UPI0034D6613D
MPDRLALHRDAVDRIPYAELRDRLARLAAASHDLSEGRNGFGTPGRDCSDYCPACRAVGGREAIEPVEVVFA